jgi:hypothetical protein
MRSFTVPFLIAASTALFAAAVFRAEKLAASIAQGAVNFSAGDVIHGSRAPLQIAATAVAQATIATHTARLALAAAQATGGGVRGALKGTLTAGQALTHASVQASVPRLQYAADRLGNQVDKTRAGGGKHPMNELCFICRQPVDGVYRRIMPISSSHGQVIGTGIGFVSLTTEAPVSLCQACDAAEADRIMQSMQHGRMGTLVWGLILLLFVIGFIASVVQWLTDSETAGYVTVVMLWSGVVLWAIGRALSNCLNWFKKREVTHETPRLRFRDGTDPHRAG